MVRLPLALLLLAVALPSQVGGLTCLETKLLETASLMELTQIEQLDTHPAVTLLRNLALGSCRLSEITTQRAALIVQFELTGKTVLLLGGRYSTNTTNATAGAAVGANASNATALLGNGTCSADLEATIAECATRWMLELTGHLGTLQNSTEWAQLVRNIPTLSDVPLGDDAWVLDLARRYCTAHQMRNSISEGLSDASGANSLIAALIDVGCPCDIAAVYPAAGADEGGFSLRVRVDGLDTTRTAAVDFVCVFNDALEVPAVVNGTDAVRCDAPPYASIPSAGGGSGGASGGPGGPGGGRAVTVFVRGPVYIIVRSGLAANVLTYFTAPRVTSLAPQGFVTGPASERERQLVLTGSNFSAAHGGMRVRFDGGAPAVADVTSSSSARVQVPRTLAPGVVQVEISLNGEHWLPAGEIAFFAPPQILSLSPSSGPVSGGTPLVLTTTALPDTQYTMPPLACRLGPSTTPATRVSATTVACATPAHRLAADPGWVHWGREGVRLEQRGGAKLSNDTGGGAVFLYECSGGEVGGGVCCAPGTAGDGSYCIGCRANTFAPVHGLATCLPCPANAAAGNSSANCTCGAGYEGLITSGEPGEEDGRCAVCEAGTASAEGGECVACAEGTFGAEARLAECSACTANSTSPPGSTHWSNCTCDATFYRPASGVDACCGAGHVHNPGEARCDPCPAGTFQAAHEACTLCAPGTSSPPGATTCAPCAADSFAQAGQAACTACPENATAPVGSTSLWNCTCSAGVVVTAGAGAAVCGACSAGTFAAPSGGGCLPCPLFATSPSGSGGIANCSCSPGYYGPAGGEGNCTACPPGLTSLLGAGGVGECVCGAGEVPAGSGYASGVAAGAGAVCVDGDECQSALAWGGAPASLVKHSCHAHGTCSNTDGSFACECDAAFYGDGVACETCPPTASSAAGAEVRGDCACGAGYACGLQGPLVASNGSSFLQGNWSGGEWVEDIVGGEGVGVSLTGVVGGDVTVSVSVFPLLSMPLGLVAAPLSSEDLARLRALAFQKDGEDLGENATNSSLPEAVSRDAGGVLVELSDAARNHILRLTLTSQRKVRYELLPEGHRGCGSAVESNVSLPIGRWSHIAVVHRTGGGVALFVNGSEAASWWWVDEARDSCSLTGTPCSADRYEAAVVMRTDNRVGACGLNCTSLPFLGAIRDVLVWNASVAASLPLVATRVSYLTEELVYRGAVAFCSDPDEAAATCVEVDECTDEQDSCDANSTVCANSAGSFMCVCRAGFFPGANHSACDECDGSGAFGALSIAGCD